MRKILLLDDEPFILKALQRLMMEEEEWEVDAFISAGEALEQLNKKSYEVIISDMRMPEMTGDRFLEKAAELQPETVRIVLSAYAEKELILNAINKGKIWTYHQKPWENDELLLLVRNALDCYDKQTENARLNAELNNINQKLESIVEEKTQILRIREQAFAQVLNNANIEEVLEQLLDEIKNFAKAENISISQQAKTDSIELFHPSFGNKYLCLEGVSSENFDKIKENFSNPLNMVLSFQALQQSPIDIDDLDELIDTL